MSQNLVKEALEKTLAVEAALEKVGDAEAPYLKGIEVLPLEESKAAMKAADEAATVVSSAIAAARTLTATKNLELKKMDSKNTKAAAEELGKLTERINAAAQKLGVFKKDTEARRKKALMQEAVEMIEGIGARIEMVAEAMKPILEKDPDTLSPEEANSMIKELEEHEKKATKQVQECHNMLTARQRDAAGDKEKVSQFQDLSAKLNTARAELQKTKKLSGTQHDKLRAKALVQEVADKLKEAEAEQEKATTLCAPILEEKCERFLVKNSIATMCAALAARMEEQGLTDEAMLKKMGKPLTQDAFVTFVGKMPEEFNREECAFSEERRIAMFKSADEDGDGVVSTEEFKAMFTRKYNCIGGISVTDVFDIGESKTICKLEVGEVLVGIGEPKKAEGGVLRMKCKAPSTGEYGWVTMQGNSGTKYLERIAPFREFCKELDKALDVHLGNCSKVSNFFGKKVAELGSVSKDSPLAPIKEEVIKTRNKVQSVFNSIDGLKKKVQQGKGEFQRLEIKEKNAHIEAKEQKEADEITIVATPAVEKAEAELKRLEDAAKELLECSGDLLEEFATPISVQDEVKSLVSSLTTSCSEAKEVVKKQQEVEVIKKAVKGPMAEAKKDFQKMLTKLSQSQVAGNKVMQQVKTCCKKIAKAKFQLAASTLQADMRSSGSSIADFFKKLAKGTDRISEEAFARYVQSLRDLTIGREHAILVAREIEVGGIGYRSFVGFAQRFLKVVKEIAITPTFDIVGSKERPVRKAECDEIFEVLEGPMKDEGSGLERVRVKAMSDAAEGWVTVKGNQGKLFLEETPKPFLVAIKDVPLESDFGSGSAQQSVIKAEEVLELVEGPRKETLGSVMRLRGKAVKDGKTGWLTMKDKSGTIFAEKGNKCYTCTATVAITDQFDIKTCKVTKKLAADETFTITEGPINEESSGIERVKGIASDGVEGWITIKGNAGTYYAKVNEKLYSVTQDIALQSKFNSDSESVRTLTAGEAIEVLEGPKEEKFIPANRAKVRTVANAEGWISVKNDTIKPWRSTYKVLKASSLYKSKGSKESVVREIAVGEALELQEGPFEIDGKMWMRAQLKKDGALGWTPTKDDAGARLLVQGD